MQVRDNRIVTVNPIYNATVKDLVDEEVVLPGIAPLAASDAGVIRKTIWFQRYGGEGVIQAYNVEGRILLEYLGNVRLSGGVHESLGFDVVDIVRVPVPTFVAVSTG